MVETVSICPVSGSVSLVKTLPVTAVALGVVFTSLIATGLSFTGVTVIGIFTSVQSPEASHTFTQTVSFPLKLVNGV